jgi:hypothetical protein
MQLLPNFDGQNLKDDLRFRTIPLERQSAVRVFQGPVGTSEQQAITSGGMFGTAGPSNGQMASEAVTGDAFRHGPLSAYKPKLADPALYVIAGMATVPFFPMMQLRECGDYVLAHPFSSHDQIMGFGYFW